MKVQQFIADANVRTMEFMIYQVGRMPKDKVTWQPEEMGRSALDMIQECAVLADGISNTIVTKQMPEFTPEFMAQFEAEKAKLDTIDKAISALRDSTAKLNETILNVSDADLETEITVFGPDPWKFPFLMELHNSNMTWHTGQICYIQTLYGDQEMISDPVA